MLLQCDSVSQFFRFRNKATSTTAAASRRSRFVKVLPPAGQYWYIANINKHQIRGQKINTENRIETELWSSHSVHWVVGFRTMDSGRLKREGPKLRLMPDFTWVCVQTRRFELKTKILLGWINVPSSVFTLSVHSKIQDVSVCPEVTKKRCWNSVQFPFKNCEDLI